MSNSDIQLLKYEPSATTVDVRKLQKDLQHLTSVVCELTATVKALKNSQHMLTTSVKTDEAEENDSLDVPLQDTSYHNEGVGIKGKL